MVMCAECPKNGRRTSLKWNKTVYILGDGGKVSGDIIFLNF